MNLNNDPLY